MRMEGWFLTPRRWEGLHSGLNCPPRLDGNAFCSDKPAVWWVSMCCVCIFVLPLIGQTLLTNCLPTGKVCGLVIGLRNAYEAVTCNDWVYAQVLEPRFPSFASVHTCEKVTAQLLSMA